MPSFLKNKRTREEVLTPDEALVKLEHFCAYRERCPQEVRRKLAELGMHGETAEQIYQVLESDGFFNEVRFAEAYAGGKFRINQWGRVRIRLELQQRAIAPAVVRQALAAIDESEYLQTLQQLLEKKRQQIGAEAGPQDRAKIAAALIRSGFEPELVFRYL
ncbi:MAG: RecX family transcriptional regulator [Saprospiraceae bacterium]|nr:RecX family transcriptional regulator [Saprospiraceae bacterium]